MVMVIKLKTKEKIMETAITLFNEKGYSNVSLREIAQNANTTIGNLTYHFKKKEDLVDAIISDLHENYSFYFNKDLKDEQILNYLIESFKQEDINYQRYAFYFKDMNTIISNSDTLKHKKDQFQYDLYLYYKQSLTYLKKVDLIRDEITIEDLDLLALSMASISAGYMNPSSINANPLINCPTITELLTGLLKPYLK